MMRPSVAGADRHRDRRAGVDRPSCRASRPSEASIAMAAHDAVAELLLHLAA
jgi:hypothetical protein